MRWSCKVFVMFISLLAIAAAVPAFAADVGHPDPFKVRSILRHRALNSRTKSAAQKPSALLDFSMRGSGTETQSDGACNGATCEASLGDCECLVFAGSLNATQLGNASWSASITVNLDDCTSTGTLEGFCCFGDGAFSATSGTGTSQSTLGMSYTGQICSDPNSSSDTSTLDTSIQGGFIILPATSSGKYDHATGTGQLDAYVNASDADGATYLSGRGVLQVVSPF